MPAVIRNTFRLEGCFLFLLRNSCLRSLERACPWLVGAEGGHQRAAHTSRQGTPSANNRASHPAFRMPSRTAASRTKSVKGLFLQLMTPRSPAGPSVHISTLESGQCYPRKIQSLPERYCLPKGCLSAFLGQRDFQEFLFF